MRPAAPTHRARKTARLDGGPTPHEALAAWRESDFVCLLESTGGPDALGRWSFLCSDPIVAFQAQRGRVLAGPVDALEPLAGAPLDELSALLARYRLPCAPPPAGAPPLLGGAVGYIGYEMLYELEQIPDEGLDDRPVPDCQLGLFDAVLAHDAHTGEVWLVANGFGQSEAEADAAAGHRLDRLRRRLATVAHRDSQAVRRQTRRGEILAHRSRLSLDDLEAAGVRPVCSRSAYLEMVTTALEHIEAGDVFQVCTTQRFDAQFEGAGEHLYRVSRDVSPAPFSAYLRLGDTEVVSTSPERLLRADQAGAVEMRPMKGTRPRGATPQEDDELRRALGHSAKDLAENVMIVDLIRNDLGRVCAFGTIDVPELARVEDHAFTFQLVSTVRGALRPELGPVDLLRAVFPGGSMTGAPKVAAMTLIDALEPVKRGVYSGCIGYIDLDGAMDFSVVIRTLVKQGDTVTFHVGGGIVADSDPAEEYQETLDKAHGLLMTLEIAREERAER